MQQIGQSVRVALLAGLHTRLPTEKLGSKLSGRYHDLWWTVYVLDRHLSSTIGCPTTVHDEEISAQWPALNLSSKKDTIFSLHVQVSRLASKVLRSK